MLACWSTGLLGCQGRLQQGWLDREGLISHGKLDDLGVHVR